MDHHPPRPSPWASPVRARTWRLILQALLLLAVLASAWMASGPTSEAHSRISVATKGDKPLLHASPGERKPLLHASPGERKPSAYASPIIEGGRVPPRPATPSTARPATPGFASQIPRGSMASWLSRALVPGQRLGGQDSAADERRVEAQRSPNCSALAPPDITGDSLKAFVWLSCQVCTPVYVGTECPPGDALPRSSALSFVQPESYSARDAPRQAALLAYLRATGCGWWRRGVYQECTSLRTIWQPGQMARHWGPTRALFSALAPAPRGHMLAGDGLPLCSATRSDEVVDGDFLAHLRLWVPRACRLPYRFPHALLSHCLAGKRLLLVGDSPLRQLYVRIMAFIRGQPHVVEHEKGYGSLFVSDRTRDESRRLTLEQLTALTPSAWGEDGDATATSRFVMVRFMDQWLRGWNFTASLMRTLKITHVVMGSNYWLPDVSQAPGQPEELVEEIRRLLRADSPHAAHLRLVSWYGFPTQMPPEDLAMPIAWEKHVTRDVEVQSLLRRLAARMAISPPGTFAPNAQLGVLPTAVTTSAMRSDMMSVDTVHLQCRWDPFPDSFEPRAPPIAGIKATGDLSCDDPADVTVIRLLLATMCPELLPDNDGELRAPLSSPS